MRRIGIIPARYHSTRLVGKPLADICGKPMVWWVYKAASQVQGLDYICIATEDERVRKACEEFGMEVLMTSQTAPNHFYRIWEVSERVHADYYISINGDEPFIEPKSIQAVLPEQQSSEPYFGGIYRQITNPAELEDISNVKIVLDTFGNCLYQSRHPIPFPKGSLDVEYKKAIGVECFNKKALDLYVNTSKGKLEHIEDVDHLRFLENKVAMHYQKVDSQSISVDTASDLEKARAIAVRYTGKY